MKLFISQVGSDAKNQELTIRNPNAAVANLRAGIAITMKIDSRSFIMSFKGKDLDDETKKLQGDGDDALGLKDGDTVTISVRRPRDSTTSTTSTSAVENNNNNNTTTSVQKSSKKSARNSSASTTTANNDVAQNMLAAANLDLNDKSKIDDASDPEDEEEEFDEEAEWLTEDEEGDEESEFDEEAEKEAEEVQKMFVLLSELPNKEEMRQRFKTDPEGTLRTLQTEKPELFELINKHPQAFLTMANEEDDDELEGEWIGGDEMNPDDAEFMRFLAGNGEDYEGDGDNDAEDDFAQLADLIAQGRADNLHDSDDTDDEEGNNNEDSAARGSGTRRTRRRRVAGGGRRATGGPSSTNTRRQQTEAAQEASLTDADNEKIMRIVELGFSREHAVRAYLRFGKNPDRAAAWLFENPPE